MELVISIVSLIVSIFVLIGTLYLDKKLEKARAERDKAYAKEIQEKRQEFEKNVERGEVSRVIRLVSREG
jgi:hypothetical protein